MEEELIDEEIKPCSTDCLDCEIFEVCNGSLKLI